MLLRSVVAPLGAPAAPAFVGRRRLVAEVVRCVSQLRVAYPDSPLSVEGTPRLTAGPRAGQRLPDRTVTPDGQQAQLHALLARPGVHVLLHRDAHLLDELAPDPRVTVHRLTNQPGTGLLAVRPDGYVGFRCGTADVRQLREWLARIGAAAAFAPARGR